MHPLATRIRATIYRNELHLSVRGVAKKCMVSKSTVSSWGIDCNSRPRLKKGPKPLHSVIEHVIVAAIDQQPLTTATELCIIVSEELGISVSRSTVYKSLKLLNMSCKVATRSRKHQTIDKHHPFFHGAPFAVNAMAFDESGFCINEIPKNGWGRKGTRVPKPQIARSKRISLLLVTDRDGIVSSKIVYGGVKSAQVSEFIQALPDNRPMILDNCAIHKTKEVRAICNDKGITLNFIPPYSPWYNPVENAFEQAKSTFHKSRLRKGCFESDVLKSVASVKNFSGIFASSEKMWLEDKPPTEACLIDLEGGLKDGDTIVCKREWKPV